MFESAAGRAILIDARSGVVFHEKNADDPMPPASMSKLMTMIMVWERKKEKKKIIRMKLEEDRAMVSVYNFNVLL